MLSPYGMGIPVKSNTTCYGPWQAAGANPGSTQVEIDDGLAPWEYGGYDSMEKAGEAKIEIAYTDQQTADRGEVTVPGIPTLSLADNIAGGIGAGKRNEWSRSSKQKNRTCQYFNSIFQQCVSF